MNLKIEQMLTPYNFTDRNNTGRIKYIVIHYFGSLGTAKAVANFFASAYRGASAHYSLDKGDTVYQCVEDGDIAWHCGTTGTYYHPDCRNSNSLGIEVRPYKLNEARSGFAEDDDWYFPDKVIDNLVEFTKYLMEKYNVPIENVIRHYDVTHKWCPRPFMGDDINTYHGESGNSMWEKFKARLVEDEKPSEDVKESEVEEVTLEEFKRLYKEMMAEAKGDNPSAWAKESCEKTKDAGVFVGDGKGNFNWQDPITRESIAVIMDRIGVI